MIYRIFQLLQRKNIPIIVYGNNDAQKFIKWGSYYSSHVDPGSPNIRNTNITIYLPSSPIQVQSYLLQTADNIFPSNWTLFGSFDNKTWDELSKKDEFLCDNWYVYSPDLPKIYCSSYEAKQFTIEKQNNNYYHFLRFYMRQNTHTHDTNFEYAIITTGFEVNGQVLIPITANTCHSKKLFIGYFVYVIFPILKK